MPENTVDKPRYVCVTENSGFKFEKEVNKLAAEGYQPQGGVFVTESPEGDTWFYQAMWLWTPLPPTETT